jgi:hypothetical protein
LQDLLSPELYAPARIPVHVRHEASSFRSSFGMHQKFSQDGDMRGVTMIRDDRIRDNGAGRRDAAPAQEETVIETRDVVYCALFAAAVRRANPLMAVR